MGRTIMLAVDRRYVFLSALRCLCLLSMIYCSQAQLFLDRGPDDAVVREGETVIFVCDLRNVGDYSIYWYYNNGQAARYLSTDWQVGASIGTPLSQDLLTRLSIIGDEDNEEFSLRIENVRKGDEGMYSCQYARSSESLVTAGMAAELTVLVPPTPQSPWCSTSAQTSSEAVGDTVNLYCNSQGGDPPTNITYYKGDERLASASWSIVHQYHTTAEDNGVIFTCVMTTPALDEPRSCSVMPLRILPNATILPAVSRVEQGSYASFECYGDGVPTIANYKWTVTKTENGEILPSHKYTLLADDRVLVMTVTGNFEVQCTVSVPSGLSANSTARIDIVKLAQTTMKTINPSSSTDEQLSPTIAALPPPCTCTSNLALTIVTVILAVAVIILNILLLWQRKIYRKSTRPPVGAGMKSAGRQYDDVAEDRGEQNEPQGNQECAYAATLEDKVNEGQDGGITSEYLEMQESPTHKGSKEYAYETVQQDKNDDTADTGKYEAVSVGKIDKMSGQALNDPTQDSSGYEMPTKLAHVYATVKE